MKQAIVVRSDVKMDKGKTAVQVAHASVSAAFAVMKKDKDVFNDWITFGQKKIAVKVESLSELMEIKKQAGIHKLTCELIRDAGLTQIEPGTVTALGIGPAEDEAVDAVISKLKLL